MPWTDYLQVLLSKWNRHYEKETSEVLNSDLRSQIGLSARAAGNHRC